MDAAHVAMLYRISNVISSDLNLDEMLAALIRLAVEVTQCDACLVYLPDPETGQVVLRASQLPHGAEIGQIRMNVGEGVTGWVAEHGAVVALDRQAFRDPRFKCFGALVEDTYEALVSVPLVAGGQVIGVINVHHREPHAHTPGEVALLTFVGEQMGSAISKARLAGQADEMRRELEARKLVERAKGILQRDYNLTEEEAYLRLRNESRRTRRPMRELAQAIILASRLDPAGDPSART
jgi:uroporphyrinogen-III synthase